MSSSFGSLNGSQKKKWLLPFFTVKHRSMILAICINSDYNKNYLAIIVKILTSSLAQLKRSFFFLNNYSQFQKSFPGVAFFLTLVLESIKCYRKLKIILFSNKPLFLFCKKFAIAAAILLNCEFINSMWALFFFQGIVFFQTLKRFVFFGSGLEFKTCHFYLEYSN